MRYLVFLAAAVVASAFAAGCHDGAVTGLDQLGSSTNVEPIPGNVDAGSLQVAASGLPAAPSNLRPLHVWSGSLDIAWNDNSSNEWGFRIARSDNGGANWNNVGETWPDATRFRDQNVRPGTTYLYKVRAANAWGYSQYSNTISVRTLP
jgi:hypothetical protein